MTSASVVVPTFGRPEMLRRCLDALARQSTPPAEVLVVVRAGDDESASAAAEARVAVRLLEVTRPGHLPPLQVAVAAARVDVVAFLDDDAEADPAWLASLLRHYARPATGGVGGLVEQPATGLRVVVPHPGRIARTGRFDRLGLAGVPEAWGARPVDALIGTNMSFRTSLLREYPWDARLNEGAGVDYEVDLCAWVRRRGYTVLYDPDAIVTHHLAPRPEIGRAQSAAWIRAYSHNLVYVSGKDLPPARRATALAHTFLVGTRASYGVATALADALRGRPPSLRGELLPALAGKLAGLRSLAAYAVSGPEPLGDEPPPPQPGR